MAFGRWLQECTKRVGGWEGGAVLGVLNHPAAAWHVPRRSGQGILEHPEAAFRDGVVLVPGSSREGTKHTDTSQATKGDAVIKNR